MSELVHLPCNREGLTCFIVQSRSISETEFGLGESIHYFLEVGVINSWWRGCFRELGQVRMVCSFDVSQRGVSDKKIVCEVMAKVKAEMVE